MMSFSINITLREAWHSFHTQMFTINCVVTFYSRFGRSRYRNVLFAWMQLELPNPTHVQTKCAGEKDLFNRHTPAHLHLGNRKLLFYNWHFKYYKPKHTLLETWKNCQAQLESSTRQFSLTWLQMFPHLWNKSNWMVSRYKKYLWDWKLSQKPSYLCDLISNGILQSFSALPTNYSKFGRYLFQYWFGSV